MHTNKIEHKLINIKNELMDISLLHNLHIIEVINIFNKSLIQTYKFNINNTIVTLNTSNQLIFYNFTIKKQYIYNLSKDKFNNFYKIFNNNILKKSDNNLIFSFYNSLNDKRYVKLKVINKTRKYLKLCMHNENNISKNITFIHKIISKSDEEFINNNSIFWIVLTNNNLKEISNIRHNSKITEIKCNINDKKIFNLLIIHFLKKIKEKTNNKFNIKIKYLNEKTNTLYLHCDTYMPILFIKYIESYILTNCNFKVSFVK